MPQINQSPIWQALQLHQKDIASTSLREMFQKDSNRFNAFHIQFDDLLLDFSKHHITTETIALLVKLAQDRKSTRLNSSHIPLSRMPSSA